jgi:serine/threonine protein kinase
MGNMTDELEKLAGLMDKGLVTREEFEARKRMLLSNPGPSAVPDTVAVGLEHTAELTTGPSSIGAYEILDTIGEGGMGEVFRARHRNEAQAERQGGDVAIKIMHAQLSRTPGFQERFEREATLGLRLEHPGLVRFFDLVIDGGTLALVMELVDGDSLSDVIAQRGAIPADEALALFEGILSAMAYAHARGVVHRDIKPDNVIVQRDGAPRILDFGIAKAQDKGATRTGIGMGTLRYMAPEQIEDAKNVGAPADIYALGMTLYEMLAGRLPWGQSLSDFELMKAKTQGGLVPLGEVRPDLPPAILGPIAVALATDPEARFPSASSFASALGLELDAGPEPPADTPTKAPAASPEKPPPADPPAQAEPGPASQPAVSPPVEPAPTATPGGRNGPWFGLGFAALLIVAVVAVVVGRDGSDPGESISPAPPDPTPTAPPAPRPLPLRSASASSEADAGAGTVRGAAQAIDGDRDTWWQEGRAKDGRGEWLKLDAHGWEVHAIELVPGLGKVDESGEQWPRNNRLAKVQLDLSDGRYWTPEPLPDEDRWHTLQVDPPARVDWVRVKILDVHPGFDADGEPVPSSGISEIRLLGFE